jgi:hypothetical protein
MQLYKKLYLLLRIIASKSCLALSALSTLFLGYILFNVLLRHVYRRTQCVITVIMASLLMMSIKKIQTIDEKLQISYKTHSFEV